MTTQAHPIWDVYDLYRTVKLNVKYYSAKLSRLKRYNLYMEIILAISLPSSAIALLWFWDTPGGKAVWQYVIVLAAVVAVIKPLLKLTDKMERYEEIFTGYRALENDLQRITIQIKQDHEYGDMHRMKFEEALDRNAELVKREPEVKISNKLVEKCQLEVNRELPASSFYTP